MARRRLQELPRGPQEAPREPQEAPRRAQGTPRRTQERPRAGPRRSQDGPKTVPSRLQLAANSRSNANLCQDAPRRRARGHERPQEAPKRPPRGPKEASRRPPRGPQEAPKGPQEAHKRHPNTTLMLHFQAIDRLATQTADCMKRGRRSFAVRRSRKQVSKQKASKTTVV